MHSLTIFGSAAIRADKLKMNENENENAGNLIKFLIITNINMKKLARRKSWENIFVFHFGVEFLE